LRGGEGNGTLAAAVPLALTTSAIDGPIPIGEAIGAVILAGATAYDLTQRIYITYTLGNASNGQIYAGRSSGYGNPYSIMWNRYRTHHMRSLGFSNPILDMAAQGILAYPAIRGREQQLIDHYGGVGNPKVGNSIRGVGRANPLGYSYWEASNAWFGYLAPFTGYIPWTPR